MAFYLIETAWYSTMKTTQVWGFTRLSPKIEKVISACCSPFGCGVGEILPSGTHISFPIQAFGGLVGLARFHENP